MSKIFVAICVSAAIISGCKSDKSPVVTQTGVNHPPNVPGMPKPPDGAVNVPRPVLSEWECSDPDPGDVLRFSLYLGNQNPPVTLLDSNISTPSYNLGMLGGMTLYYWKIVARDDKGASTEGPVWRFTTEN